MWTLLLMAAQADTIEIGADDDLWGALSSLSAGDEVVVASGTYPVPADHLALRWEGTADAPVVVRAAEPGGVVIVGDPERNIFDLSGQHYALSGFTLIGGSKGLRLHEGVGITLSDLIFDGLGSTAISLNDDGRYRDVSISRIEVRDAAGCISAGCDDGRCTVEDIAVTYSLCHQLHGEQAAGLSFFSADQVSVRHNVIADTSYPGIQIFGDGLASHEVTGNLVMRAADNGIQVTAGAELVNNIVLDAGGYGVELKGADVPLDGVWMHHNTVVNARDACLKIGTLDEGASVRVTNNALLCGDGNALLRYNADAAVLLGNAYSGALPSALTDVLSVDDTAAMADGRLPDESPLIDAAASSEAAVDFNCAPRDALPDIGALEWSTDGPAWSPAEALKPSCAPLAEDDPAEPSVRGGLSGGGLSCGAPLSVLGGWPLLCALLAAARRRAVKPGACCPWSGPRT